MKRSCLVLAGFLLVALPLFPQQPASQQTPSQQAPSQQAPSQQAIVSPPESLVVGGVPPIPASLAETASRYGSYRAANMVDAWKFFKENSLSG